MMRRQLIWSISMNFTGWVIPALLMRTSILRNRSMASAVDLLHAVRSVTSHTRPRWSEPRPCAAGAYDAAAIVAQSKALGHVPLIDRNFRGQHEAKAECAEEVARMKFIHLPDPDDALYDFRTMAERVNARLKDEFGARFVRVRGAIKVKCHLMFGVLVLAVDQLLRASAFTPAPA